MLFKILFLHSLFRGWGFLGFLHIKPEVHDITILYHEATFMEEEMVRSKQTEHSTARQAGEIALKANVKKLIIGHYSARYTNQIELLNEAKAVFENTVLGEDLTEYEI